MKLRGSPSLENSSQLKILVLHLRYIRLLYLLLTSLKESFLQTFAKTWRNYAIYTIAILQPSHHSFHPVLVYTRSPLHWSEHKSVHNEATSVHNRFKALIFWKRPSSRVDSVLIPFFFPSPFFSLFHERINNEGLTISPAISLSSPPCRHPRSSPVSALWRSSSHGLIRSVIRGKEKRGFEIDDISRANIFRANVEYL